MPWLYSKVSCGFFFVCFFLPSGEVFHNIVTEDHIQPSPVAPRSSPTGLASLPPLNGPTHPPVPNTHLPSMGTQPFPKTVNPTPGFMEANHGLCLSAGEQPSVPAEGHNSGPNSVCRSGLHNLHEFIFDYFSGSLMLYLERLFMVWLYV